VAGELARLRAHKTMNEHRADALVMLEVTEDQLLACPKIEHLILGLADTRYEDPPQAPEDVVWTEEEPPSATRARKAKRKALEYLSGSEELDARTIMALRGRLTATQADAVPFEAYCVAAGLSTKRVFGLIASETAEQSALAMSLVSKARRADVVQAAIDMAMSPLGDKDRKLVLQAEGYAPVPRTAVTHVHGNVDARQQTVQQNVVLPPVEDSTKRLNDRFNAMVVKPTAPLIEVEAEPEDDED